MTKRYTDHDLAVLRNRMGENIPVPPKPRKRKNEESRIQMAVIRFWAVAHKDFGVPECVLFSIPNGGWRDVVGAAILKKEGQRNGVSDLMLAVPRGGYHGLFLEMKCATGVISPEQIVFQREVGAQGYATWTAFRYETAVDMIGCYLRGTTPEIERADRMEPHA